MAHMTGAWFDKALCSPWRVRLTRKRHSGAQHSGSLRQEDQSFNPAWKVSDGERSCLKIRKKVWGYISVEKSLVQFQVFIKNKNKRLMRNPLTQENCFHLTPDSCIQC